MSRERAADRRVARDAVETLERAVPAHDPLVRVEHHQPVVERLEDVLVELAHPAELLGLEVQLRGRAGRSRSPSRPGRRPRSAAPRSSLLNGSSVSLRPSASTAIVAPFEDARHEVVDAGVAPELDFLGHEARGGDRIVERRRCGRRRARAIIDESRDSRGTGCAKP